jgi:hypothetical protein
MNTLKLILSGILMLAATQSWAVDESLLDLRYEASVEEPGKVAAPVLAPGCSVVITMPNDQRRNKETLGTTFRDNPIISKQAVTGWLQDALFNLKKSGLNVVPADAAASPDANTTVLSTDLSKMYIWNHGMNLHATLVIDARMQTGAGPEVQRHYRVISTKLNWVNGDSEFVTTLNLAANRLLDQIASDIGKQCQASPQI